MQPKSIILFFYGYILFFRRQLSRMQENVEVSEKNEEISKILLQVVDELKIVCHNLESELNQF